MMKSTVQLLTLLIVTIVFAGCQTVKVDGKCPALAVPPKTVLDTLQKADDSAVDAWVVSLDRHYRKLAVCSGK